MTLRDQSAAAADPRWRAVVARDASADGLWVYAVTTTGVYCRPSCAARQPSSAHVSFFDTCEAAESAGFRPCKRCRPDGPSLAERDAALVADLARFIEASPAMPTLAELASRAGLSESHTHRIFRAATGLTPRQYAASVRAKRTHRALAAAQSVTAAVYEAGYSSSSRFYEHADAMLGMRPAAYRSGGAGLTIRYAFGDTSLGTILVASTDIGVCAVLFGSDVKELLHDLESRFPNAELEDGDESYGAIVTRAVALVEHPERGVDLPLDIRGTAFQQRVWNALREIPPGRTASYSEVAETIGAPTAVRAVASACAANPLAVAVPCHRVVRADGGLSGYRWGVERKRALLKREEAAD